MRILLTGGTGFVGAHLLRTLRDDHELWATARAGHRGPEDGTEWIEQDLSQPLDPTALPPSIDAVLHLAQSHRYREFPDGSRDVFALNVQSTFELLEYARSAGAQRFVLASTGGVYGSRSPARESDPIPPSSPDDALGFYRSSKHAAELLAAGYADLFSVTIMRPFFVYGPGQRGMLVRTLADRVLAGETVTVQGDPGMRINPIYVGDAARAIEMALVRDRPGTFNLAGDETVSITELVELIAEVAGREATIEHAPASGGDLVADSECMRTELGVRPETRLRDGLARLLDSIAA